MTKKPTAHYAHLYKDAINFPYIVSFCGKEYAFHKGDTVYLSFEDAVKLVNLSYTMAPHCPMCRRYELMMELAE